MLRDSVILNILNLLLEMQLIPHCLGDFLARIYHVALNMSRGFGAHCCSTVLLYRAVSFFFLSFFSELRILLLCGSDLLESFCIPGLWNVSDVSILR